MVANSGRHPERCLGVKYRQARCPSLHPALGRSIYLLVRLNTPTIFSSSMTIPRVRTERRKKQRIQLTRSVLARFGATGVLILDITDEGARIEHFSRMDLGRRARLRFGWQQTEIEVEATVMSCKVHRFA